ncbi:MAG: hypothetical protein ABJF10_14845 [Chthoniobacter sp.]|uniref:hypothetical protein n=1 Tax=Chthoniobacter sp. TaxID=2510640 RepID=UPI0032A85B12
MPAIPAIAFLLAFLACSLVGRLLLVKAAFGVSPPWGLAVLLVPFGPFFFRMKHREIAHPTRHWRRGAMLLLVLFFVNGGNADSVHALTEFGKTGGPIAAAGDTQFHLPVPAQVVAAVGQPAPVPAATPAPPAAGAPAATPSKAVAASASTMSPAPKVLSPAERIEANRKEFERLAEWYDNLKHERGYLRKGDDAGVAAFNVDAAKYQTALQLAKTEQAELAKLMAKK